MAKVHPNAAVAAEPATTTSQAAADQEPEPPTVLTVWRKSLLFNCDGFTVYDPRGDLAFRVDCYAASRRRRAEVVLMDAAGPPLLTVRRKRRSAGSSTTAPTQPATAAGRLSSPSSATSVSAPSSAGDGEAFVVERSKAAEPAPCATRAVTSWPRLVIALDEMFGARGSTRSWLRSAARPCRPSSCR